MSMAHPPSRGFTLVELMVTMAIAALLLAVGVPGMTNLARDARLSSQADLLVSSLNYARTEAVRQRVDFTVCPATTPSTGTACTTNLQTWGTGWIAVGNSTVVQRVDPKSGVTITAAFDDVTFRATVGNAAASRSFTLCVSGRKQQLVDVNLSGNVSKRVGTTTCS